MIEDLVIGGGLAGGSLALRLARAGRPVVLLEREAQPHDKVCGEFLSWEAVAYLRELEVSPEALGAVAIDEVRLFKRSKSLTAPLPFPALSLSRRSLDEALLTRAQAAGAVIRRGVRVTEATPDGPGWRVGLASGAPLQASQVYLATGKHDVRGRKRPPGRQSDLVGFKMYWRLSAAQAVALEGAVELHLFRDGYAGLELVEGRRANLCLVIRRQALQDLGGGWPAVLERLLSDSPALADRLSGAEALSGKPLAISAIPYGYVRRRGDGLWRLGDQAAVIPSFAGEGMSIALHSAALAAAYRLRGESAELYQVALAAQVQPQVGRATLLSQLLVRGFGQTGAMSAARVAPALVGLVATGTRLPSRALAEVLPAKTPRAA